jgi:uncharacterized membrane protein (DUF2068 family)
MSRASGIGWTLRLIATLKLAKGLLLLGAAVGALRLLHHDVTDVAATWTDQLHLDPESRVVEPLLERLAGVDDRTLKGVGAGSLFYSALLFPEGVGLMWGNPWAEYLTIVVTPSLVPIEIYEIARHATAIRVGVLVLNLVIVGYLVVRVHRERSTPQRAR